MLTINYVDDGVNIGDFSSDAETVNYMNKATVEIPKKGTTQLQVSKTKKV